MIVPLKETLKVKQKGQSPLAKGRVTLPNWMNFRKSNKGVDVIFNPQIYIADFGPL